MRYDATDNLLSVTTGQAPQDLQYEHKAMTKFEYDLLNRRTAVSDPLTHRTQFLYDTFGNIRAQVDGRIRSMPIP